MRAAGVGAAGTLFFSGLPNPPTVEAGELTSDVEPERYELGAFAVDWRQTDQGEQLVVERDGTQLWASHPGENFLEAVDGEIDVTKPQGPHLVEEDIERVRPDQHVSAIEEHDGGLEISGSLSENGENAVEYELWIEIAPESDEQLRFEATSPASPGRLGLRYEADPDEQFHGFGQQARHFDLDGKEVRMITEEPGISRDHVYMEFLVELDTQGASGTTVSTYAPAGYYLSNQGYSFVLENQEYSVFDLRRSEETSVRCYADTLSWRVIGGDTALDRIESYTEYCGRMPELPDWIHEGAIVGMQGGTEELQEREGVDSATERVQRVWEELDERDTPLAGFWLQDWVGVRITGFGEQLWWDWELDEDHYPNWDEFVEELNDEGVELLGYVNPYLVEIPDDADHEVDRYLFEEAKENDYLVTKDGEVFGLTITTFDAAIVDLSNEEAYQWLMEIIADEMADNGFKGWMADFGEGLPFEGEIANGQIEDYHNEYVVDWAALNRDAMDYRNEELDDAVFFTRSGFTQSPRHSTLFWTGDQYVSWDDRDGLQTSIRALLTSGLSGISLNHFDAGGYTSIEGETTRLYRRRELLKRWNEVSAFTAVFRTHEGNEPQVNAQIYDDDDLYDHFSRCSKVYASFAPYRKEVCEVAAERGLPVVRPLFLHYENAPRDRHTEFLLGRDVLVAPVVRKDARRREVFLPDDEWVHIWSGDSYDGGTHRIGAPLGEPPVFYRADAEDGALIKESLDNLREYGVLDR